MLYKTSFKKIYEKKQKSKNTKKNSNQNKGAIPYAHISEQTNSLRAETSSGRKQKVKNILNSNVEAKKNQKVPEKKKP